MYAAIELFPSLEREAGAAGAAGAAGGERERSSERGKAASDKHVREVIFALPSLQLHLRTHHLQPNVPPTENGNTACTNKPNYSILGTRR